MNVTQSDGSMYWHYVFRYSIVLVDIWSILARVPKQSSDPLCTL